MSFHGCVPVHIPSTLLAQAPSKARAQAVLWNWVQTQAHRTVLQAGELDTGHPKVGPSLPVAVLLSPPQWDA